MDYTPELEIRCLGHDAYSFSLFGVGCATSSSPFKMEHVEQVTEAEDVPISPSFSVAAPSEKKFAFLEESEATSPRLELEQRQSNGDQDLRERKGLRRSRAK